MVTAHVSVRRVILANELAAMVHPAGAIGQETEAVAAELIKEGVPASRVHIEIETDTLGHASDGFEALVIRGTGLKKEKS